jgi:lipopolysaccharide/colanic/teichoic acid biosynthesis glycosyltransferase
MALHDEKSVGRLDPARVPGVVEPGVELGRGAKRIFDIAAATIGLILFSPILIIASIAIKFDSRGPVFSRETLYGYSDRRICVFKFRLMTTCPDGTMKSRVTRAGRVLRQTGISEIPQLLNVLRGDMSIVGPSLYVNRQDKFDYDHMPLLKNFKPGITGLAQISESRDEFVGPAGRHINEDLRYVEGWSLFLDIKIILMTILSQKTYARGGSKGRRNSVNSDD